MSINWRKLQNGSDIRGVALPLVPEEKVNLTNEVAESIGASFASWISRKTEVSPEELRIGVGTDSRISGPELKKAMISGITSTGANVLDFGLATTPAMFMSTQFEELNCQGGIMLTASHLPPNRNGMKFFTQESGLGKMDITEILQTCENENFIKNPVKGKVEGSDILAPYSNHLVSYIRTHTGEELPLKGLKIIVDAGNGAGGFFAESILQPLGADTKGSQFLEPDGNFPNHIPNPEDKEAMESICNAVVKNKADLGIIFDTDVDRSAIVDETGRPINRNALIALLSAIILEEHPGSTIVTDSVTSSGLAEFIAKKGGKHHRFKRGYKNVINESIRLNETGEPSWLAIETSGHGAMKENFNLDDGAYMVAKSLVKMAQLNKEGRKITALISELKEPAEATEHRIKIATEDFHEYGTHVIRQLENFVKKIDEWEPEAINYEGLRVKCNFGKGKGWFLLRLSLHDPILPLNIESDVSGGIEQVKEKLIPFFEKFDKLENISIS